MMKVKQIGTVVLQYPLWVDEFEKPGTMMGEALMSASGSHIVYQAKINTPYITLISKDSGWLSAANIASLKTLYNTEGTTYTIIYDDDSTAVVRFAHEKGIVFTPVFEGACDYYATINMAKA